MEEYTTFFITAKDGRQVEMAVVNEFDCGKRHYIVSAVVENDTISDDGQFIYRCRIREDGFDVEQIQSKIPRQCNLSSHKNRGSAGVRPCF